jgi:hypothetical protein
MRLKPRCAADEDQDDVATPPADVPAAPRADDQQVFFYDKDHVLVFSVYDSCRKDVLVSSSALDTDVDLALLGSASVRIEDLVQRVANHENDPRTGLTHTLLLVRDKNQSLVAKTFEQLGKGVNMINNLSFFADEALNSEPAITLSLAPIRCICCSSNLDFCVDCAQECRHWHAIRVAAGLVLASCRFRSRAQRKTGSQVRRHDPDPSRAKRFSSASD